MPKNTPLRWPGYKTAPLYTEGEEVRAIQELWNKVNRNEIEIRKLVAQLNDELTMDQVQYWLGRIRSGYRITDSVSGDTTLTYTQDVIFANTDSGSFTVSLPAGKQGKGYRIINCGSNDLTIAPNGSELLDGLASNKILSKYSVLDLIYDTTEGWW